MNYFESGVTLTFESATDVLSNGLERIASGAIAVDCSGLTQFDSSALAVLLAWQRAAKTSGVILNILNLPKKLISLSHAYGLETLIGEILTIQDASNMATKCSSPVISSKKMFM
ncbi:MAG: STAS domain-containing protein [Burkholderia sp.]|nr:STAS domain-containing protein [Burkholderia sp.]